MVDSGADFSVPMKKRKAEEELFDPFSANLISSIFSHLQGLPLLQVVL